MKNSFVLFTDDYEMLSQLNAERVGNVMMAVYSYELGLEIPELDMAESVAFAAIKKHLDATDAQYTATIDARSKAGKKSAEVRKAKLNKAEQCSTNSTVTVTDTVTVNKEKDSKESKKKAPAFVPPTIEEVKAYCEERHNHINPIQFVDFYQSKGWMIGKNKMKDWRASVRQWETRSGTESRGTPAHRKAIDKAGITRNRDLDDWLQKQVIGGIE